MLNQRARNLIGYDRLVEELAEKIDSAELEELETANLKKILGPGYEEWEFKDWYRLLTDIKRKKRILGHETVTAEAIFNSLPWAAQQAAQEAVKILLKKAADDKLFKVDEAAETAAEILWNMFYCMIIDIKNTVTKLNKENKAYSRNDMKENKLLLDFIEELRKEQWREGEVARIRSKEE